MRWVGVLSVMALLAGAATALPAQAPGQPGAKAGSPAERVDGNTSGAPVVVAEEVLESWNFLYRFITEVEFVLCLEGRQDGRTLYIDGVRLAKIEATSPNSVRYEPCRSERYVGTAHNHPPVPGGRTLCYRSLPDRQSFDLDYRAVVDVVLCGERRYFWVLKDGTSGGTALAPDS